MKQRKLLPGLKTEKAKTKHQQCKQLGSHKDTLEGKDREIDQLKKKLASLELIIKKRKSDNRVILEESQVQASCRQPVCKLMIGAPT